MREAVNICMSVNGVCSGSSVGKTVMGGVLGYWERLRLARYMACIGGDVIHAGGLQGPG